MIPQHDSFYDVFSRAAKLDIRWPDDARIAVALAGNLEAWTETPDPKLRRSRHVGGSNPLTEDVRCPYDFRTASENDYGGRTGVWRILRILEKYGVKASFNTNALCALRYPEAVKKVHEDGHEVVAHSYAEDVQLVLLSRDEEREEMPRLREDLRGPRGGPPVRLAVVGHAPHREHPGASGGGGFHLARRRGQRRRPLPRGSGRKDHGRDPLQERHQRTERHRHVPPRQERQRPPAGVPGRVRHPLRGVGHPSQDADPGHALPDGVSRPPASSTTRPSATPSRSRTCGSPGATRSLNGS